MAPWRYLTTMPSVQSGVDVLVAVPLPVAKTRTMKSGLNTAVMFTLVPAPPMVTDSYALVEPSIWSPVQWSKIQFAGSVAVAETKTCVLGA